MCATRANSLRPTRPMRFACPCGFIWAIALPTFALRVRKHQPPLCTLARLLFSRGSNSHPIGTSWCPLPCSVQKLQAAVWHLLGNPGYVPTVSHSGYAMRKAALLRLPLFVRQLHKCNVRVGTRHVVECNGQLGQVA